MFSIPVKRDIFSYLGVYWSNIVENKLNISALQKAAQAFAFADKHGRYFCAACIGFVVLFALTIAFMGGCGKSGASNAEGRAVLTRSENSPLMYTLPSPNTKGSVSVEEALAKRRSHRRFQNKEVSAAHLSQLLWAAYGITEPRGGTSLRGGLRTTPSAGAIYPLEIYVVAGNVQGIEVGMYKYDSETHTITRTITRDVRNELAAAALGQTMVRDAPLAIVYTAVFGRLAGRYGERAQKYAYIEVGHSAQNIYLQAESLRLGTCAIGAFTNNRVREVLRLPSDEEPIYIMPIGMTGS